MNGDKVNPDFKRTFFRERSAFAFQNFGQDWKTSRKPLGDGIISKHLNHKMWIGTRAGWYVEYGCLDLDTRDKGLLQDVRDYFNFDWTNSLIEQSPNKGYHILFKPRFNDKPPSQKLYYDCLTKTEKHIQQILNLPQLEIFPKSNRALRGPLGKNQIFIDPDNFSPYHLDQEQLMSAFEKLYPTDLKEIAIQRELPLEYKEPLHQKEVIYSEKSTGEYLYHFGPQSGLTRYETTWKIILYLFRLNFSYDEIYGKMYQYILKHQKWFSENSRHGHQTFQRTAAQIRYLRRNEAKYASYPDFINNAEFCFGKSDLLWLLKTFPRKNEQRAMFNLIRYYRPRQRRVGDWVRIHRDRWRDWLSWRTDNRFQQWLKSKKILESRKDYVVGKYARHYKLNLPRLEGKILHDGRQIRSFETALVKAFTNSELNQLLKSREKLRRIKNEAKEQTVVLNPEVPIVC